MLEIIPMVTSNFFNITQDYSTKIFNPLNGFQTPYKTT